MKITWILITMIFNSQGQLAEEPKLTRDFAQERECDEVGRAWQDQEDRSSSYTCIKSNEEHLLRFLNVRPKT